HSSGRRRHPLELNQLADVVAEVHHPDLEPCPRDADGAHDLAAHRALLLAEYVLDTGAHLRARRVRRFWRSDGGRLRAARRWIRLSKPSSFSLPFFADSFIAE